jgi:chromosome segregation ATPase
LSNLDFKGMIEANYNVLSNLEASIQGFFRKFEDIDTKIVEKETAFINAKQEFKELIEDYKSTLDKIREDFNLAVAKEQKEFIEVVNTNTEKILKAKEEELQQKLEQEEHKILLKTKKLLDTMESFQENINSKILDTIKNLPMLLEEEKDLIINKTLENIKETSKTLQTNIENYRKVLDEELRKYKDTVITQVDTCKDTLKNSTEAIKEVAEDIKAENITLNKNRSNLEADYNKVNTSLNKVSKDTNNLAKSINNIKYTFIINKIYIFLFSLLNSIFILRIIVPQEWSINFYGEKTRWTLIIVASLLIIVAICDFMYRTILPILSSLWEKICNFLFTSEEEAEED